jgi:hypothetical protein
MLIPSIFFSWDGCGFKDKDWLVSGQAISIKDLKPDVYFLKTEGYKAERLAVKP